MFTTELTAATELANAASAVPKFNGTAVGGCALLCRAMNMECSRETGDNVCVLSSD
jgi:hypothetical protein